MDDERSLTEHESSEPDKTVDVSDLVDAPSWYGQLPDQDKEVKRIRKAMDVNDIDRLVRGMTIGRYRPIQRIGQGAMGTVYRAESDTGQTVALKIMHPFLAQNESAVQRFRKEASILQNISNSAVVKLYEFGTHHGLTYLALEHVTGTSLGELVAKRGPLPERLALEIIAHVARGLAELHDRGVIHRDVKPSNVMVVTDAFPSPINDVQGTDHESQNRDVLAEGSVKLADFGLARQIVQSESVNLTRADAVIGTPQYMAPEQFTRGNQVDPATDVYAIGATLFEILTGRPPLGADGLFGMADEHLHTLPPMLNSLNHDLSQAVSQVVAKTLEKNPAHRHRDARAFLSDIEKLLSGRPTEINVHPILPDSSDNEILHYELVCELDSAPQSLWRYVSNTERINHALDLPPVQFTTETDDSGRSRRLATVRFLGMQMSWQEHPFEWIEGRKMSVLREFNQGPFKWITSVVELRPRKKGGTTLIHRFDVVPAGPLGKFVANFQIGWRSRHALQRVYQRIDNVLQGNPSQGSGRNDTSDLQVHEDAFERPHSVSMSQRKQIDAIAKQLSKRDIRPDAILRLVEYVARSPSQLIGRIRPVALAGDWGLPENSVLAACLHAADLGLLTHRWDIYCPACSVPTARVPHLNDVKSHGRCEVCDIQFRNDLVHRVELVFQVHSDVRASDQSTYCIGGPWHLPHVVAQCRIAGGESHELGLSLAAGNYRVGSPQLSTHLRLHVEKTAQTRRCELQLDRQFAAQTCPPLTEHCQAITLCNQFDDEVVVRIERTSEHLDILSAAKVASLPLFRQLFPQELPNLDRPTLLPAITLVVAKRTTTIGLDDESSPALYSDLQRYFRSLRSVATAAGGCVIKTVGDTAISLFYSAPDAIAAAIEMINVTGEANALRTAIHRGPVMMMAVDNQIEYMGETLERTLVLSSQCRDREMIISDDALKAPLAREVLRRYPASSQRVIELANGDTLPTHVFRS